jgi:NAD(P)-dependent dehydrogenase (short-subunit alcohol dehydrogenase family)
MSCILVTGCSSGIGLATALTLGRAGHTVFATMRNADRAPQFRETIDKEKLPISVQTLDVTSDESVAAAFSAACAQAGFLQALVNNAGAEANGQSKSSRWKPSEPSWRRTTLH